MPDRDLRVLRGAMRADFPVAGMVADMVTMMMTAHPGVGVEHARLELLLGGRRQRLGDRRDPGLAGARSHRGSSEHGNCDQRRGNCLQHGRLLCCFDHDMARPEWRGLSTMRTIMGGTP